MHYWTEDRIRESYRRAEFPRQQISILAQLTDSEPQYIEAVCGLRPETTLEDKVKRKSKIRKPINTALIDQLLPNISLTFAYIAKQAGCTESAVQKYYAANKHRFPCRKERNVIVEERILKYLVNPNLRITQIIELTGYSSKTVYKCYKKHRDILPDMAIDGRKERGSGTH